MTGNKVCNKCGKKNLGWDYDFNKKTGKWKLENHKRQDGKWCNKPPENKYKIRKKWEVFPCFECGNQGMFTNKNDLDNHMKWGSHVSPLDTLIKMQGTYYMMVPYWVSDKHFANHIPSWLKDQGEYGLNKLREYVKEEPKYKKYLKIAEELYTNTE